jgi:hypothetical protein
MTEHITGGCQCGAVRYVLSERPEAEFCHCGMCRRATGGAFAALATVPKASLQWTRGEPAVFRSSTAAERRFCAACGTPLLFSYDASRSIDVTIGSLDDPELAGPLRMHFAVEHRLSWVAICDDAKQIRLSDYRESPAHQPEFRSLQASPTGEGA